MRVKKNGIKRAFWAGMKFLSLILVLLTLACAQKKDGMGNKNQSDLPDQPKSSQDPNSKPIDSSSSSSSSVSSGHWDAMQGTYQGTLFRKQGAMTAQQPFTIFIDSKDVNGETWGTLHFFSEGDAMGEIEFISYMPFLGIYTDSSYTNIIYAFATEKDTVPGLTLAPISLSLKLGIQNYGDSVYFVPNLSSIEIMDCTFAAGYICTSKSDEVWLKTDFQSH